MKILLKENIIKNIIVAAILLTIVSVMIGQAQTSVSVKYPGYLLSVPATLQGYIDADLAPIAVGKIDVLPKKAEQSRFGLLYRDDAKNLSAVTVLELLDAGTNKVFRKINLEEYFGTQDSLGNAFLTNAAYRPPL